MGGFFIEGHRGTQRAEDGRLNERNDKMIG